jgi:hypothetical protein
MTILLVIDTVLRYPQAPRPFYQQQGFLSNARAASSGFFLSDIDNSASHPGGFSNSRGVDGSIRFSQPAAVDAA